MKTVFPAVFERNSDNSYTISFPDLPGCISEGKSLDDALYMAQAALTQWAEYLREEGIALPVASESKAIPAPDAGFVQYVSAELKDARAVRRTVSLPKWLDESAARAGLSLSKVLQDALTARLG